MKPKEPKNIIRYYWGKFWYLLWKDDSLKGWVFSLIFLFIFIKFIFFPILSLATGTALPLAIVESCSMYHKGNLLSNFDSWYERHESIYENLEISRKQFKNYRFKKGFNSGDILFIIGVKPEEIKVGDVIIYKAIQKDVIHRVISIKKENGDYTFSTMGDSVGIVQPFEETINQNQLVGKAVFKFVPYIGWGKLIAVDIWNKVIYGRDLYYLKESICYKKQNIKS